MNGLFRQLKLLRYGSFVLIVIIIGSLGWWYFFLRTKNEALQTIDTRRGVGTDAPSFQNFVGSTYGNILSNLSSLTGGNSTESNGQEELLPRLAQITQAPVAGMSFVISGASSTLRFVERGTGYVLEANPKTGDLVRLTNTLVPQVYEALVGNNDVIILRTLDESGDISTSAGVATTTASNNTPASLPLSTLARNISDIALSTSNEEILYLVEESDGRATVAHATWNGQDVTQMTLLGISGWAVQWVDEHVILTQHPASGALSHAYELSAAGTLSPIVPAANGLVVLPKPGSTTQSLRNGPLIFSMFANGLVLSSRVDASTQSLPVRTSADKCVWAPGNELIVYCAVPQVLPSSSAFEERLRGGARAADIWWRVNIRTGSAEPLYAPSNTLRLDVESPTIDSSGSYIAFMNATDKSLWLLRVEE